jgi:hypothetical protein
VLVQVDGMDLESGPLSFELVVVQCAETFDKPRSSLLKFIDMIVPIIDYLREQSLGILEYGVYLP